MDTAPRPAHPDGGRLHVHVGPALPGDALAADGRLDAAHQVGAAARRRRLRVSGVHAARALLLRHAACRRLRRDLPADVLGRSAVGAHPGRARPARGHGLHHQPHVPHPVLAGAARLHILVPRGRAGDIVRLVARRRVGGDGEGRGHHVVPAGAGRRARRLGPLLVLALQRRGRLRARARAQRRAAGGHADGQRGAVGLPVRAGGAAGGGGAARAVAHGAARQLIDASVVWCGAPARRDPNTSERRFHSTF